MKACPIGAIVRRDEIKRIMYRCNMRYGFEGHELSKARLRHRKFSERLWKKRLNQCLSLYKQFKRAQETKEAAAA